MSKATPQEIYAACSQAEKFVDAVTLLRMVRVKFPTWNPADYGIDGTAISDEHMRTGRREQWDVDGTGIVDIAHRFEDGSVAVRIKATQRWEVWRTW
jgi:hypothetical protein